MKNLFLFCLLMCLDPGTAVGQSEQSSTSVEKMRVQGYLIIEGHHETIRKGSDIPRKFLFIPMEKFKDERFLSVYERERQPIHHDLFIPTSFMEEFKLDGMNVFLRRALNSFLELKWEDTVNNLFEDYLSRDPVFFKSKGANKELCVIFIDGLWGKLSVSSKYYYRSNMEGYNMARLEKLDNRSQSYDYYYALETKSFAPVVFLDDDSMRRVKR